MYSAQSSFSPPIDSLRIPEPGIAIHAWRVMEWQPEDPVSEELRMDQVRALILQNPALPYTQERLAHSLGLSPSYFCRLFHARVPCLCTHSDDAEAAEGRNLLAAGGCRKMRLPE